MLNIDMAKTNEQRHSKERNSRSQNASSHTFATLTLCAASAPAQPPTLGYSLSTLPPAACSMQAQASEHDESTTTRLQRRHQVHLTAALLECL